MMMMVMMMMMMTMMRKMRMMRMMMRMMRMIMRSRRRRRIVPNMKRDQITSLLATILPTGSSTRQHINRSFPEIQHSSHFTSVENDLSGGCSRNYPKYQNFRSRTLLFEQFKDNFRNLISQLCFICIISSGWHFNFYLKFWFLICRIFTGWHFDCRVFLTSSSNPHAQDHTPQ